MNPISNLQLSQYKSITQCLLSNGIMNLSLVLTVDPLFLNIARVMKTHNKLDKLPKLVSRISEDKILPEDFLQVLGYCSCSTDALSSMDQSSKASKEEKTLIEELQKNCKNDDISVANQNELAQIRNNAKIRKRKDEKLPETHPTEIKIVINPKTGRKNKTIYCKIPGCNRSFEKKWNYKEHINMHRGEKPYKCTKCSKSYTQKGNLTKHMRQHQYKDLKSRKVHQCPLCPKKFTEKYNLKFHLKTCQRKSRTQ
ncbi:unnamed protein product [Moneuplotes crassus]|uniref:C2H2-type domain-containing protein n=1 Tax=Euplotes crassus TaxID=5936 RepID=A0AAD1X384_EUPCR|nr:unnamed protein product [Moneuplotes crassus]